jgi:hypothetical protein
VLANHQDGDMADPTGRWPKLVLADLERGLRKFGPITPRQSQSANSLPDRGVGVQPDGRVTLAVSDKFVVVKDLSSDPPDNALGAITLDSITLTAAEWSALAPLHCDAGTHWTIPEAVARRFFPVLSTGDTVFRSPGEITSIAMSGRVDSVENGMVHLRYEGHIAGTHHGTKNEAKEGNQCSSEARMIGGVAAYDPQTRKMLRLTLVYDGLFRNYRPYASPPTRYGAVVEWSRGR